MPAEEVKAAAAELGRVKVQDDGSDAFFHPMKVTALHSQFEIVFTFQDGKTLSTSEVWIPRPGPEKITVRFRDIDVFGTPALQLVAQFEDMPLSVLRTEPNTWIVPHLSLGFTRTAGHDVPLDTDDAPLYFQAVLAGPSDYYDALLT